MSISSFEGWEPDDLGGVAVLPQAEDRPLVDVRPIDEFEAETVPEHSVQVDRTARNRLIAAKERERAWIKAERRRLKDEIANIESYPDADPFDDGTVLIWHDNEPEWGDSHYAAVKDVKWYVAGRLHGYTWDQLVASVLCEYDYTEIEVVRPAKS